MVFVANYSDPWMVKDEDAINALKHIWNAVYTNRGHIEDFPYHIDYQDCVYFIVRCFYLLLANTNALHQGESAHI